MAANIEQIFQDFILNKIREIEDLSEDKGGSEEAAGDPDRAAPGPAAVGAESPRGGHDHHKKHRKHKKKKKKKKKKKNRDKEGRTESGSDVETESRRGTPSQTCKKPSEDHESRSHRHRSAGKKKKKKKRRKDEENSSDEESRPKQSPAGPTSVRRQEELPDIIPKQDSVSKGRGDEEGRGLRSSPPPSPPHSRSPSHSCSGGGASGSRQHQRGSRSPSESRSQGPGTSPSSSEKKPVLDKPPEPPAPPPPDPPPPPLAVSSAHSTSEAGGPAESRGGAEQSSELSETREEERAEKPASAPDSDAPQSVSTDHQHATKTSQSEPSKTSQSEPSKHLASDSKSEVKKKRKRSKSPPRSRDSKSSRKHRRSKSPPRSHRGRSRSKSPAHRKRSRSRSGGRRSWRSRSRSASRSRKRVYSQRDRWKREPSHSPVLILRKNRSPARKHLNAVSSPQRISDLDKEQLLEIAKANAAAMCAKAGMPIPASLRSTVMPLALPSMAMNAAMASMTAATVTAALSNMGTLSSLLPLPSITNKPPAAPAQPNIAALEEVRRKVAKQANSISIKEFTDKCRMIVDSSGELPVALPHVSDEEEDGKPFGESALREQKLISFSLNNMSVRPAMRSDVEMAKEFPVSSGSQHRKKEGDSQGAYGEWVPVDKKTEKPAATSRKPAPPPPVVAAPAVPGDTAAAPSAAAAAAGSPAAAEKSTFGPGGDNVFPDPLTQPVDITQAVTERIKAQRRLAENPYDISAICMLSRAQEQVDAWAQSSTVPGLFTGSTGAQVLTSEELSAGGPQAWLKKDQFLRAAPVSGGVGEFLMRKMGWRTGEGLGRNREGTVEPIVIDFKVDRKGLVAEGEKPQKQTGGLVVTKDMMGKHPVSALIELCNKKRIMQPDFVMVHHSGPDHRKNFLFKVTVDGVDYQPQSASPNKKHAKAMAATVALQALGEVPADGPGLYTGPVFTAASTGPLFST